MYILFLPLSTVGHLSATARLSKKQQTRCLLVHWFTATQLTKPNCYCSVPFHYNSGRNMGLSIESGGFKSSYCQFEAWSISFVPAAPVPSAVLKCTLS